MQKIVAILLLCIFLLGCTSQTKTEIRTAPIQKVNTANISFSRDAVGILNSETEFPTQSEFEFGKNKSGQTIVSYFYSPHCSGHLAVRDLIDRLKAQDTNLDWREYDITTQNGTLAYLAFANEYNLSENLRTVPRVLVNGKIFTDSKNINESLETTLEEVN